jgi:hypothetical protein
LIRFRLSTLLRTVAKADLARRRLAAGVIGLRSQLRPDKKASEPRRSSMEKRQVRATAQFHFDTPQLAAGSFIFFKKSVAIY